MSLKRSSAAHIAGETVAILKAGHYKASRRIDISEELRQAIEGTVSYPPDAALPAFALAGHRTRYEVNNETTLDAARRLVAAGNNVAALNFASARHPGGGFLNGARAQEESLCRASGLYFCINGNDMYGHHAGEKGGFYTNYAIYSPDVPVIRDDEGELLNEPYPCSFITAPAINAGAVRDRSRGAIRAEMGRRVHKVLSIAAGHGHEALVLGAWGCGVFKNDPEEVATLFREALGGEFHGVFSHIVFAILDWSGDHHFIGPFERLFSS